MENLRDCTLTSKKEFLTPVCLLLPVAIDHAFRLAVETSQCGVSTRCQLCKFSAIFYEYFFDGISDGSIRHGNNAEYSTGTIQVWKAFGVCLQEYYKKDILFDEIMIYMSPKNHLYLGNWMVKRVRWSVGSVIRLKVQW